MSRQIQELDRALSSGIAPSDEELARMVDMGNQIRDAYVGFTPPHSAERAMFVRAVTDRVEQRWSRFLAPVTVTAVLLLGVLFIGRTSLPGEALYPVREVLRSVGLAPASIEEIQTLFGQADGLLDRAEALIAENPEAAERLAFEATRILGEAEGAINELEIDERAEVTDELADLLARAEAILTEDAGEDTDRDADGRAAKPGKNRAKNNQEKNGRTNRSVSGDRSKRQQGTQARQRRGDNRSTGKVGAQRRRTPEPSQQRNTDGGTKADKDDTSVGTQRRTTPDQDRQAGGSTKDRVEQAVDLDELEELKAKGRPRG